MDFTINVYKDLLLALKNAQYKFQTFNEFLVDPCEKAVVLRHDVDLLPQNSLRFAQIQNELDIKGSYYFRAVPESWDEHIIKGISGLGHEVGYHYETMDTANGNVDLAWEQFGDHLNKLRELAEVNTICMHGSPRSKYDNKAIWEKYDYQKLNIIGEPYFDIDFDKVFYLTDTGRRWDGHKVSVRDKLPQQTKWNEQGLIFHSTAQLIKALNGSKLPDQIMFTFHPQRWHLEMSKWFKELIMQNIKNIVKYFLIRARN